MLITDPEEGQTYSWRSPGNILFIVLLSGERYRNLKTHTTRLWDSSFPRTETFSAPVWEKFQLRETNTIIGWWHKTVTCAFLYIPPQISASKFYMWLAHIILCTCEENNQPKFLCVNTQGPKNVFWFLAGLQYLCNYL